MLHSLTEQTVAKLQQNGFVVLREFAEPETLAEIEQRLQRVIEEVLPSLPPEQVYFEDRDNPQTLKQIQQLGSHDPFFGALHCKGTLRGIAEQFLEGSVVPKNVQYFNKPPQVGQATPPHQDGYYFMLEPCDAITLWLALDGADEENGCVRYVRGSHRKGLRSHSRTTTLGFSQGISDYPTAEDQQWEVPVPVQPGDLLAHHALTIHRADGNQSTDRPRRAIGFVYFSAYAREDSEAQDAYQKKLSEDLRESKRI